MSRRIVLDASAAVPLVLRLAGARAIDRAVAAAAVVLVPDLYVAEVANALCGYVTAGQLDRTAAIESYIEALELPNEIVNTYELGVEALNESVRLGYPAYDLVYAVLARRTASALLTRDKRLAALTPDLGVRLALVGA